MRTRDRTLDRALLIAAIAAACGCTALPETARAANAWDSTSLSSAQRAEALLGAMTLTEKLSMLHGGAACGYVGCVDGNSRLGIPALHLQDGPAGVGDKLTGATQLPAPVAGAASWDTALMQKYGEVIGIEHWNKNVNISLAPTINIVRDPRWGRAFESLGEDPFLAGKMGSADIQGIQSQGPMAQVKHYVAYNQETYRNHPADNVIVSDRTLHEIYLPAFEHAVTEANVASVMCSYNWIGGVSACDSNRTLVGILKGEIGFTGFVTSDWGATHTTDSANHGLDMEMAHQTYFGDPLTAAVKSGAVPVSTIDDKVRRILTSMFRLGLFDHSPKGSIDAVVTTPGHVDIARRVAIEGSVLLKNSGGILPLTQAVRSIAVIGDGGDKTVMFNGGGSSSVIPGATVSPYQGIKDRAGAGANVTYWDGSARDQALAAARSADVAVVFATVAEREGLDLTSIDFPDAQNQLIADVAAANPRTVVVINSGSAMVLPWAASVGAIIEAWYPGQEYGRALAALLFGDENFSGRLPVTFPRSLADVPASTPQQFPGVGNAVEYSEGEDVGYRWYDRRNIEPMYPFSYGLSYTTFSFSNLVLGSRDAAGHVPVAFDVTNTGSRAGAEVAQVYVSQPANVGAPPKSLAGFSRVVLAPNQTAHVTLSIQDRRFRYWNGRWTAAAGSNRILVGSSSRSLPLAGQVMIAADPAGQVPAK